VSRSHSALVVGQMDLDWAHLLGETVLTAG